MAALNVAVGDGDAVQWVGVAVFSERAHQLAGTLHKGDRVYCEGRLKLESWTGKDGQERSGLKITAWKAERLGEIGRNKPPRSKAPPDSGSPVSSAASGDSDRAARRDWQRPADQAIPF